MMNQEFDTINTLQSYGLNGWFSGFCPSNGIADRLNSQARGVWAQKATWDKNYNALKNGKQAAQWESLKKEVRRLEAEIKNEGLKLVQEKEIATTLGLGAFCRKAVSGRKKAEESLRSASTALGHIKGAFQTLENQQRHGISQASKVIATNKKNVEAIKNEILMVKKKIALYKAQRDNKAKEQAQSVAEKNTAGKQDLVGKLKENSTLIIGGLALVTAFIYMNKKRKPLPKSVAV